MKTELSNMTVSYIKESSRKKRKTSVSSTLPGNYYLQDLGNSSVWVMFDAKPAKKKPVYIEI